MYIGKSGSDIAESYNFIRLENARLKGITEKDAANLYSDFSREFRLDPRTCFVISIEGTKLKTQNLAGIKGAAEYSGTQSIEALKRIRAQGEGPCGVLLESENMKSMIVRWNADGITEERVNIGVGSTYAPSRYHLDGFGAVIMTSGKNAREKVHVANELFEKYILNPVAEKKEHKIGTQEWTDDFFHSYKEFCMSDMETKAFRDGLKIGARGIERFWENLDEALNMPMF